MTEELETDWFAWYPVSIDNTLVWLETVRRKGDRFEFKDGNKR